MALRSNPKQNIFAFFNLYCLNWYCSRHLILKRTKANKKRLGLVDIFIKQKLWVRITQEVQFRVNIQEKTSQNNSSKMNKNIFFYFFSTDDANWRTVWGVQSVWQSRTYRKSTGTNSTKLFFIKVILRHVKIRGFRYCCIMYTHLCEGSNLFTRRLQNSKRITVSIKRYFDLEIFWS